MVNFGEKITNQRIEAWKGYYLDYNELKKELESMQSASSTTTSDGFKLAIDREIEKVVLFFLHQQGLLANELSMLRDRQAEITHNDNELAAISEEYRRVGNSLTQLVHFVDLNVIGLRKILKKHDKNIAHHRITGTYLTARVVDGQDSHLHQLHNFEGIGALVATLNTALIESRALKNSVRVLEDGLNKNKSSDWESVISKLNAARGRLAQSSEYVTAVASQALIFESESFREDDLSTAKGPSSAISNWINLASTFLYMMNYYIVAPTSRMYAIELSVSPALSGMIIGMTPIAALLSSVLYSWWANKSFKPALLFASSCSILGNVLYALALPCNSLNLLLAGRLLNGFGGARAINRRYIADVFDSSERTKASALFVTAGALGMSAGPAAAVFIKSQISPDWTYITNETAPGYVMGIIWSVFFVVTSFHFQEPYRSSHDIKLPMTDVGTERQSLLGNHSATSSSTTSLLQLWSNIPVRLTLIWYFVLKLVLEVLLSGTPNITYWYFDWRESASGTYLAFLGLLMFPANYWLGYMSYRYDDRDLIIVAMSLMLVGIFAFVNIPGITYGVPQYVLGSVIIFISTNMLEGVNMSLLSKTIPRSLARGTFNSGLLATEAGTLGRAMGDIMITVVGLFGLQYLLDYTFIPMGILTLLLMGVTIKNYTYLIEAEDDDD